MRKLADKKKQGRESRVGDVVYVKFQPYKLRSIAQRDFHKLSVKYFGVFKVKIKIGKVSYRIKLLEGTKIQDVFHILQLKKEDGK